MKIIKRSVVLLLPLLVSGVVPAGAQAPPRFFGGFSTTPGGWSEYAVTEYESGKSSTMRTAIVAKEGDSFWYEIAITESGVRNIIKMFLKGDPNDPENIQRLIMKNGDQPAQEMPREFVVMGRRMATHMFENRSGSSVANQANVKNEEMGAAQVSVPAGTFEVTRNRIVDAAGKVLATYYFNKDVLPFGIVSSQTEKVKMELLASGNDAVSMITEEPLMMTRPPGMPDANPRGVPPGMEISPASGGYGSPAPAAPSSGGYGAPAPAPASGGYGN